jgi:hypothetical protein
MNGHGNWLTAALPFAVLAIVIALRLRSMGRERPLKLSGLWLVPAIYVVLAGSIFATMMPPPVGWALALGGLLIGTVVGWHRGKLIQISRDVETGELRQRASPLAMLLLVVLIVLKLGARALFGDAAATQPGSAPMLMTDAFLGFALGLLSATRLEIYLRARRLIEAG